MQVAIPKLTFRIHDNPLLENTDLVVFIIEKERIPTLNYQKSVDNCSWSFHQFNLLLQVLIGLDDPRVLPILVDRANLATVFEIMNQNVDRVVTDYTTDPAFHIFDEILDKVFGQKLDYLSTFTLLDWREPVQQKILANYWTKATVYAKLTPLKEHILSKPITSSTSARKLWAPSKLSLSNILHELERYRVDLPKLLKHVQNIMANNRMHPHSFSFGSASWDSNLLSYVQKQVALIDRQGWYKPDTAIGVDFGWKIDGDNLLNGSQLSPFLSIGALSVKTFWTMIKSNEATMGSAKDQLLFRECFHATAIAAETISIKRTVTRPLVTDQAITDRITHFWDNTYNAGFGKESDIVWNNDPATLRAWQEGALVPSDEWFDTNDSMRQLWVNGWIHHLRRHLVADVLTRGQLGIDWRHGERWFRHTLIDHDAAVNRANWMWLAAVAFSSKQKIYHYSPDDYVRRKSQIGLVNQLVVLEQPVNGPTPSRKWKRQTLPDGQHIKT